MSIFLCLWYAIGRNKRVYINNIITKVSKVKREQDGDKSTVYEKKKKKRNEVFVCVFTYY